MSTEHPSDLVHQVRERIRLRHKYQLGGILREVPVLVMAYLRFLWTKVSGQRP